MPPATLSSFVFVALGGAVGACLRYAVSLWSLSRLGAGFPYGTLAVNVVGSAMLGLAAAFLIEAHQDGGRWRVELLMIGALGGFTTFSTFSLEAVMLALKGRPGAAALYVALSVLLAIAAAAAGLLLGRWARGA